MIRRLAARGACVVFVSHKLEEVFAVCDTVTVLRDGRSVLESSPLADHTHDDIVGLMVGRAHAATEMRPHGGPHGHPNSRTGQGVHGRRAP